MTTHTPLRCSFSQMAATGQAGARVVLLDSGNYPSYSSFLNETWTFSGTDWTNQSTTLVDANGPLPGRNDGMMAFDGNNTVLFGGRGGSSTDGVFQDTWLWSGTAWTKKAGLTVSPFGRYKAEMAFLQGTGVVMFGGRTINDMLLETWVWNGTTQLWSQVSVANGAGPAARVDACFAGNAGSPQAVLFGGAGTNSLFRDTWTFNGTSWTQNSPATSPPARSQACMTYATAGGLFVLFGGTNGVQYLNDTWVYNGTTWTQVTGSGPAGRVGAEMAYDATSSKVIMFGGNSAGTNYPSNETWAFDAVGLTWTQL